MYITMDIALCYNHHNPPHPIVWIIIIIINYILRMYTHTGFVRSAVVVCCRSYSALLGNLQITYRYLWHVYMIINKRCSIDSCKSTSTHVFFVCLQVELKFSYLLLASCLWLFPWLNRVKVPFRAWPFSWSRVSGSARKFRQGSTTWQVVVQNVIICLKVKTK